jgi:hypothetical protein
MNYVETYIYRDITKGTSLTKRNIRTLNIPISLCHIYNLHQSVTGWWFQTCFIFHHIWDVILPIDELIFFKMGWNHQAAQVIPDISFTGSAGSPRKPLVGGCLFWVIQYYLLFIQNNRKTQNRDTYYILWTITFGSTTGTHGGDLRCTDGRKTPPPAWFSVEILIKMAADRLLLGKHGGATSACRIGHHGATVEHCMLVVGQRQLVLMASVFRIYWPSWRQFERSKKSEILTTFIWVSIIWAWFWGEGA